MPKLDNNVLNIPNALTATRIIAIPVFITALNYKRYDFCLYIFLFAAATDVLDGLLARITNQKTKVGTVLDPVADKFMLVTSYVLFSFFGWLPTWLMIMIISRDVIIISGCFIIYFITHSLKIEPTVLGKLSTVAQSLLILVVLLNINYGMLDNFKSVLVWLVAAITVVSGLQYIFSGLRAAGDVK